MCNLSARGYHHEEDKKWKKKGKWNQLTKIWEDGYQSHKQIFNLSGYHLLGKNKKAPSYHKMTIFWSVLDVEEMEHRENRSVLSSLLSSRKQNPFTSWAFQLTHQKNNKKQFLMIKYWKIFN